MWVTQDQASRVHNMTGLLAPDLKRDILGRLGSWICASMVQHSPSLYMDLGSSPLPEKKKRQQNNKEKTKSFVAFCCHSAVGKLIPKA